MSFLRYMYEHRAVVHTLPRVLVDFNDLDTDGQLYARAGDSDRPLQEGSRVILWDGEGNSADGQVVAMTELGDAVLAMVPGSWREDATAEPSGFWHVYALLADLAPSRVAVVYFQSHGLRSPGVLRIHVSQAAGMAPETASPGVTEEIGAS